MGKWVKTPIDFYILLFDQRARMGICKTKEPEFGNLIDLNDWHEVQTTNAIKILVNNSNPRLFLEQHPVKLVDDKQLDAMVELYHLRTNDPDLVSAQDLKLEKEGTICSNLYSGHLYTEHIPIRLNYIAHVPFPDVLHLYNQVFNGFQKLSNKVNSFKISEDCVGINDNHVIKVWHSPDFASSVPIIKADSEHDMVRNLVSLIQGNTDMLSMPAQEPSFANFLFRDTDKIGFAEAKKKLQQYSNRYNQGIIPKFLNCITKAGGAESIRRKFLEANSSKPALQTLPDTPTAQNHLPPMMQVTFARNLSQFNRVSSLNTIPSQRRIIYNSDIRGNSVGSKLPLTRISRIHGQLQASTVKSDIDPSTKLSRSASQPNYIRSWSTASGRISKPTKIVFTNLPVAPRFISPVPSNNPDNPDNIQTPVLVNQSGQVLDNIPCKIFYVNESRAFPSEQIVPEGIEQSEVSVTIEKISERKDATPFQEEERSKTQITTQKAQILVLVTENETVTKSEKNEGTEKTAVFEVFPQNDGEKETPVKTLEKFEQKNPSKYCTEGVREISFEKEGNMEEKKKENHTDSISEQIWNTSELDELDKLRIEADEHSIEVEKHNLQTTPQEPSKIKLKNIQQVNINIQTLTQIKPMREQEASTKKAEMETENPKQEKQEKEQDSKLNENLLSTGVKPEPKNQNDDTSSYYTIESFKQSSSHKEDGLTFQTILEKYRSSPQEKIETKKSESPSVIASENAEAIN